MSTDTGTSFQRARTPEQKEQRRQDILAAATTLGARDGVRAVTLTDIAAEAGVHKSAVLRYFETREAVFLLLTAEAWQDWAAAVDEALRGPSEVGDVVDQAAVDEALRGPSEVGVEVDRVAGALAATLAERPLFCDLLAHAPLHLERGVSEQEVRGFKLTTLDAVDLIVRALRSALPGLDGTQAIDLVAGVTAMAAALWQTANPPETLARLCTQDPRLAHAAVEFAPRLTRMIAMLLTGATVRRDA